MKVLVIGATGFLGSEICKLLQKERIYFNSVSRSNSASDYLIDISNYSEFSLLPNNFFDIIINCATTLPGGSYLDNNYLEKIYKTNLLGSQNICKWVNEQSSIKKIINCSTLVVVTKPWQINLDEESTTYPTGNHVLYCSSKLMQELLFDTFCKARKIVITHVRFSSLYGETMNWSGIICNFIDQAKNTKKITLTNGNHVNADFLNIDDAANIILTAVLNDINGIINAASGKEISILKLATIIANSFSETVIVENIDESSSTVERAIISTKKLEKYIKTENFMSLETGVKQLLAK